MHFIVPIFATTDRRLSPEDMRSVLVGSAYSCRTFFSKKSRTYRFCFFFFPHFEPIFKAISKYNLHSPNCSHEVRPLLLGGKPMTNLTGVLKSRDITLPTKMCMAKAMVSPVVTYGCESWTIKKAEWQGIDDFKMWC